MKYSTKYKLMLRLIVSPIVLALLLVTYLVNTLRMFIMYIRFGGEWLNYDRGDVPTMYNIFQKLKENEKTN